MYISGTKFEEHCVNISRDIDSVFYHNFSCTVYYAVLSVRFEVGVSLLLAPTGADKRGPKAPFPLVENARIQPVTCKRVPAGAPARAGSY